MKTKERYNVGHWAYNEKRSKENESAEWDEIVTDVVSTEKEAISLLEKYCKNLKKDDHEDYHFIMKEVAERRYDYEIWTGDDEYNDNSAYKRLYDFQTVQ